MSNLVSVVGTVATEPKKHRTDSGVPVISFRLAANERRYNRETNEWESGETNWFTVNAFRGLAEHALTSFYVGDRVFAHGRLRVRKWEKGDAKGISVEIEAESLGHDLLFGTSSFTKVTQQGPPQEEAGDPANGSSAAAEGTQSDGLPMTRCVSK